MSALSKLRELISTTSTMPFEGGVLEVRFPMDEFVDLVHDCMLEEHKRPAPVHDDWREHLPLQKTVVTFWTWAGKVECRPEVAA